MKAYDIDKMMEKYVDSQEIAGAALMVRKRGKLVYQNKWGYADQSKQKPIEYDSIYRMMSLTKVSVAVGVMKLVENGFLSLDTPLSEYIPSFRKPLVVNDPRYTVQEGDAPDTFLAKLALFDKDQVKTIPADRELTVRDLLSHSSGLEMGVYGILRMLKYPQIHRTLEETAAYYADYPLDFQPGTGTGYSGFASFDVLLRVCEIVTVLEGNEFMRKTVFEPLGMKDSTFILSPDQEKRLVRVYKRVDNTLTDVTGSGEDIESFLHIAKGYPCGSGGLYSTITDYERLANMLCAKGTIDGAAYLKPETVRLMAEEAPKKHLEPEPGYVWGLGVKIRQDKDRGGFVATEGTYGWSGAFGTHLFVSPADKLDCVFTANRSDAGGSGFYISKAVEDMVFKTFTED